MCNACLCVLCSGQSVRQFATNEAAVAAGNGAAITDSTSAAATANGGSTLPQGWELKYTSTNRPYYVSCTTLCNI
jgi:hypothetical protein